jgi:ribosomal protein S18 acetylase RimI-like enzyme
MSHLIDVLQSKLVQSTTKATQDYLNTRQKKLETMETSGTLDTVETVIFRKDMDDNKVSRLLSLNVPWAKYDALVLCWFYLCEIKVWNNTKNSLPLKMVWHLLPPSPSIDSLHCLYTNTVEYYQILTYMIHDRVSHDKSFFQNAEDYLVAFQNNCLFSIRVGTILVGYAVVQYKRHKRRCGKMKLRERKNKKLFHIQYYEIFPKYQRQGIGKQAMDRLSSIAKQKNCEMITLEPTIYARPFYKKIGFQIRKIYSSSEDDSDSDSGYSLEGFRMVTR